MMVNFQNWLKMKKNKHFLTNCEKIMNHFINDFVMDKFCTNCRAWVEYIEHSHKRIWFLSELYFHSSKPVNKIGYNLYFVFSFQIYKYICFYTKDIYLYRSGYYRHIFPLFSDIIPLYWLLIIHSSCYPFQICGMYIRGISWR